MSAFAPDRREFLLAAATLLVAGCHGKHLPLTSPPDLPYDLMKKVLAPYLAAHPAESELEPLESLLACDDCASSKDAWAHLARRSAADFAAGDLVEVGGWSLSRTEVRLWAWLLLAHAAQVSKR